MIRVLLLLFLLVNLPSCSNDGTCSDVLIASIEVADFPSDISSIQLGSYTSLPSWDVTFDANHDGSINKGDLSLEGFYDSVTNDFYAFLYDYRTETRKASITDIDFDLTGNTITLSVCKGSHPLLYEINESTMVNFETRTYDPTTGYTTDDTYPAYQVLSSIPSNFTFTDPQGDADFGYIDMVNMSIMF